MAKAKIILTTKTQEILIATFPNPYEAGKCCAILQASTNSPDHIYQVEHKNVRRMAEPLTYHMQFVNDATKHNLKLYFNNGDI